jgi:hypothetical protein
MLYAMMHVVCCTLHRRVTPVPPGVRVAPLVAFRTSIQTEMRQIDVEWRWLCRRKEGVSGAVAAVAVDACHVILTNAPTAEATPRLKSTALCVCVCVCVCTCVCGCIGASVQW